MVLQQIDTITIWGKAKVGQKVWIEASWGSTDQVQTDKTGKWKAHLWTPAASYEKKWVKISTPEHELQLSDILIGELWLCAGQSNMGFPLKKEDQAETELKTVQMQSIRLFHIQAHTSSSPLQDFAHSASWQLCDSSSAGEFSAVAYYFGKKLSEHLDVPIGIVSAAHGGASAEAFMSKKALLGNSMLEDYNQLSKDPDNPFKNPSYCYNAMIHPLLDFSFRGVSWYQGESNCIRASKYEETLTQLIESWRQEFNDSDLPFFIVQLPAFRYKRGQLEPGNPHSAASLRDAQAKVVQKLKQTGLIVTLDLGDIQDIHPTHKQPVGNRLATQILHDVYGFRKMASSGPVYKSHKIEGHAIRISFDYIQNGIKDTYGELSWFTIAGVDKKFYQGNAFVEGKDIVVSSPFVKDPVAVRYAWHNEAMPNFYNKEGLLGSPFRTDTWDEIRYVKNIISWSSSPDIRSVPFDLSMPSLTNDPPRAGKRVRVQLDAYLGTSVYHVLYLPENWSESKTYPIIVEYPGNGPFVSRFGDSCSGKPEDTYLGFGISGGRDFICVGMPFISKDGTQNQLSWWGDRERSIEYTIEAVNNICREFGGDTSKVFLAGFSRGAIACNYIGLHNDKIAGLWTGFIANTHYDGVRTDWGYPDCDAQSAIERLNRLKGRPQIIISEKNGPLDSRNFIEQLGVKGDFTYLTIPYRNHDPRWILQNINERQLLRKWIRDRLFED